MSDIEKSNCIIGKLSETLSYYGRAVLNLVPFNDYTVADNGKAFAQRHVSARYAN